MILTNEQQAILDGAQGETLAKVMKTLVMYGDAFGAEKLVPVTSKYNHLVTSFGLKVMAPVYDLMQQPRNLATMRKDLPVFFIAGGDDPVGTYGKGVRQAAEAFRKAGMTDVSVKIYPLCRHEILNEINKEEIYGDVTEWIGNKI